MNTRRKYGKWEEKIQEGITILIESRLKREFEFFFFRISFIKIRKVSSEGLFIIFEI